MAIRLLGYAEPRQHEHRGAAICSVGPDPQNHVPYFRCTAFLGRRDPVRSRKSRTCSELASAYQEASKQMMQAMIISRNTRQESDHPTFTFMSSL